MTFFEILCWIQKGDKSLFDISVEEQKYFLDSLGEPKDDIDRGLKQYLCQNYFVHPKWKIAVLNIIGACAFPFLVIFFLIKGFFTKRGIIVESIIERKGMDEVVPPIVWERYHPDSTVWSDGASISFKDISFILRMAARAPLQPYFVLKAFMNIVFYSHMIRCHNPKTIIQFGEFSFSSSILTALCHKYGIRHLNIMHGEKLFFIRDAFFHYDECYVWSDHYVNLLRTLKAEPSQFIVALPPSLNIDVPSHLNFDLYADYKYYLAEYTEEQIKSIVHSMSFALDHGKSVKYRPHPRYSNIDLLKKYVEEDDIEDFNKVNILDSIANLECAVGSYSTVLAQAYFSGKEVILDDMTFAKDYQKLKERSYILANKNISKLSSFQ